MPSLATSGSVVRGQHRSNLCLLHLKKLFPIEVVAYKHKRINLFGVKKKKKKKRWLRIYGVYSFLVWLFCRPVRTKTLSNGDSA